MYQKVYGGKYNFEVIGWGVALSTTLVKAVISGSNFIKNPTLISGGNFALTSDINVDTSISVTGIEMPSPGRETIVLFIRAEGLATGKLYYLRANNDISAKIIIDANI